MKRLLDAFGLAWNMLTVIPLFKVHTFYKGINGISAAFYPLVGLVLGGILYSVVYLLHFFPGMHVGVIAFALWVLLSGALHLDGFSDTIDGLFVAKERALEVMKDSHVGGMGMVFSFSFLLLKASSVVFLPSLAFLPFVLGAARFNAVAAIYFFPYISKGVAQLIKEELHLKAVLFAFATVFIVALVFDTVALFAIALVYGLAAAYLFTKRYGGLNGDMYGFIIETSELLLLNLLIATV